jgi:predicted dienelactone hydrolase
VRPATAGFLLAFAGAASAQQPFAVRREVLEFTDSAATKATMWSPMGKPGELATLLFSPGLGQTPQAYSKMLSTWAGRGFVVIGISHPAIRDSDKAEPYDVSQTLAWQLARVVEHIVHDKTTGSAMFARVDPMRIGAAGHSVGGSAAAQACAMEQRLRACMDLDGTIFGPVVHTGMTQPFFLIKKRTAPGKNPQWSENRAQGNLHEDSVFANTRRMHWLVVDHMDHMAFTDAGLDESRLNEARGVVGFHLPARKVHELTTRYVVDFFGTYLRGDKQSGTLNASPFRGTELLVKR